MPKTISSSDLRAKIKHILNEVSYGQSWYIVERFGEPTAAIVSVEDLYLLQAVKEERGRALLHETLADLRVRGGEVAPEELDALIEEARAEFYAMQSGTDHD